MYKLNLAPYERMTTNLGPSNEMYVMDMSLKMRFRICVCVCMYVCMYVCMNV